MRQIPKVGDKVVFKNYPDMPFKVYSIMKRTDPLPVTIIHPLTSALFAVSLREIKEYA